MNEVERKDVAVKGDPSEAGSPSAKVRQVSVDTRSREAFELLKIGEAICNLQVDQRSMRLDADDMRFERDRYKASAAAFQDKLNAALDENNRLRDLRKVLAMLPAQLGAESEEERNRLTEALQASVATAENLRRENESLNAALLETDARAERVRMAYVGLMQRVIEDIAATDEPTRTDV